MISADGPSSLSRSVASNVTQGLQLGSDLTGVDLQALLSKLSRQDSGTGPSGDGAADPSRERPRGLRGLNRLRRPTGPGILGR